MARVVLLAPVLLLLVPPPPAECAASAAGVPVWPVKRAVVVEGDVMLGGLMMVHEREDRLTCGPIMPQGGIQALECMLFTLDWVNRQGYPFSLGAYVLDDCDKDTYGLEQAVDFIKGSIGNIDDGTYRCPGWLEPRSDQTDRHLGRARCRLFGHVHTGGQPAAAFQDTTGELLFDKPRAEQQKALRLLKWTYVSILYEESTYGNSAFDVLERELGKYNICIAVKEKLTKDSGVASEITYDEIVKKLTNKPRARGVIIFGSDQEVAGVMRAVSRNNATGHRRPERSRGSTTYFRALTPHTNRRNPWFIEFWEHFFGCKWNGSLVTPFNQRHRRSCTGEERISDNKAYKLEAQLQFVSNAVLAFAHALRRMHEEICGNTSGLCDSMRPVNGTDLLSYLKNVTFQGLSKDHFRFSSSGDGPARYNILHFKQVEPGKYRWVRVGTDPCPRGSAQKMVDNEQCCWHCVRCSGYTFAAENGVCADCAPGTLPDVHHERCVPVPESHMSPSSPLAVATLVLAAVGTVFTAATLFVFLKHIDTPVVRASGRELCFVLLGGICMCQGTALLLVQRPSTVVCGAQRAALGLCFAVVYSAVLAKAVRIHRIFHAGRRSAQRPGCISPRIAAGALRRPGVGAGPGGSPVAGA
ncbi:hypothetical protein MRX96_003924 [Rhipicephalus microplus]